MEQRTTPCIFSVSTQLTERKQDVKINDSWSKCKFVKNVPSTFRVNLQNKLALLTSWFRKNVLAFSLSLNSESYRNFYHGFIKRLLQCASSKIWILKVLFLLTYHFVLSINKANSLQICAHDLSLSVPFREKRSNDPADWNFWTNEKFPEDTNTIANFFSATIISRISIFLLRFTDLSGTL